MTCNNGHTSDHKSQDPKYPPLSLSALGGAFGWCTLRQNQPFLPNSSDESWVIILHRYQADKLVDIVRQMDWRYVAVLATEDTYGGIGFVGMSFLSFIFNS